MLPVDWGAFVVAQRWEYSRFGQVEAQLTYRFPQHVQVIRTWLVPHVVRRQISRPDHEINILSSFKYQHIIIMHLDLTHNIDIISKIKTYDSFNWLIIHFIINIIYQL